MLIFYSLPFCLNILRISTDSSTSVSTQFPRYTIVSHLPQKIRRTYEDYFRKQSRRHVSRRPGQFRHRVNPCVGQLLRGGLGAEFWQGFGPVLSKVARKIRRSRASGVKQFPWGCVAWIKGHKTSRKRNKLVPSLLRFLVPPFPLFFLSSLFSRSTFLTG